MNDKCQVMIRVVSENYCIFYLKNFQAITYRYSNTELTDMHFYYGMARVKALRANRLYQMQYPHRNLPKEKTFTALHQRLTEYGKFITNVADRARGRCVRSLAVEENIFKMINNDARTSTRKISRGLNVSQSTTWRFLCEQQHILTIYRGFKNFVDGI